MSFDDDKSYTSMQLELRNGGSSQDLAVDVVGELVFLSSALVATKVWHTGAVISLVEAQQHLAVAGAAGRLPFLLGTSRPRLQQDILGPVTEVLVRSGKNLRCCC